MFFISSRGIEAVDKIGECGGAESEGKGLIALISIIGTGLVVDDHPNSGLKDRLI